MNQRYIIYLLKTLWINTSKQAFSAMYVYFNLNKILFLYYIRMRFLSQLIDNISIYHINWSMVQCGSSNRFTTLIKKTSLKYFKFAFLSTENLDKSFFYLFLFINEVFLLNSGNALIIILCVLKKYTKVNNRPAWILSRRHIIK